MTEPTRDDWAPGFFTPLYARMYRGPLFDAEGTDREVAFLASRFADCDGPLLDVGCGFGRHAVPLRKHGHRVVGLDRFAHLLREQPARGRRAVAADMRTLPFPDGAFAGLYCVFNTFGYFEHRDNQRVLREWARVVRPGGRLVLQAPHRPVMADIVREHEPSQTFMGGATMSEEYAYDGRRRAMLGRGVWQTSAGEQAWSFELHLYAADELEKELARAGWQTTERHGDYDGADFDDEESAHVVFVAQRKQ
jgi:SAM-dependent methyltransferase